MNCITKMNWPLLRKQKETLIELADARPHQVGDHLWGIINLLDAIQDEAVDTGLATSEEVFGKLEI